MDLIPITALMRLVTKDKRKWILTITLFEFKLNKGKTIRGSDLFYEGVKKGNKVL